MAALKISQSDEEEEDKSHTSSTDESFCCISECAMAGTVQRKSFQLQGTVKGKHVLLLVDSGSCGSFINTEAVQLLGLYAVEVPAVTVKVANGAQTQVKIVVQSVEWQCQKAKFCTDFRVFDLPHYDMILGMDWLDTLGPMWIDWKKKTFRIKQGDKRVTVRGPKFLHGHY